jgi:uncharacterized membrane protein YdjX (TVP38/TMEM64 family)
MKRATILRLLLLGVVVAGLLVLPSLPLVREAARQFRAWLEGLGTWGLVLLAVSYTPAALLLFPAWLLTVGAGAVYGVVPATIAISAGSTVAAAVVFLLGRTFARPRIEKRFADQPWFPPLDQAVAGQGFKIVLLMRLSPVFPFTWLNYAFSLTGIPFRTYLLASWMGMLPGTVMYVYLGSAAKDLTVLWSDLLAGHLPRDHLVQSAFFLLGLVVTVAVTVVITRLARQALHRAVPALATAKQPAPPLLPSPPQRGRGVGEEGDGRCMA